MTTKRGGAVLDAPLQDYASAAGERSAAPRRTGGIDRSVYADKYADSYAHDEEEPGAARRPGGKRLRLRGGLVPRTLWGRIAIGCGLVLVAGFGLAALIQARNYLFKDEHFVVQSSSSIEIAGNSRLSRAQLLSVFGEDVERSIFNIPLAERRAELERLPWVRHATVMRLLPNRVRVAIVERTPVAFVRQGSKIGLVDANGVLLDMNSPDGDTGSASPSYSFPVLTGISAQDPMSTRTARMKIYLGFLAALDANGQKISEKLSEVDLSNPEDVKAIVPDSSGHGTDTLVHFGAENFLERYAKYEEHLAEWKAQYPRLASVDMRYERQVVLEMQPGSAPPANLAAADAPPAPAKPAVKTTQPAVRHKAVARAPAPAPPKPATVSDTAAWVHTVPRHAAATHSAPAPSGLKIAGWPIGSQGAPR